MTLLDEHAAVCSVLARRSPADFRPLPSWVGERASEVVTAFTPSDTLPPSLIAELAPLVAPRLERVVEHLRRRLGRERVIQPLPRVREMDPACLRRNARLPGASLVEKAGPRQELLGVVRVPRFDTMENRVLVSTCRALLARAEEQLRARDRHERGAPRDRRTRDLRRLARACEAVLARPELAGVGASRPGERPSNALRGDADYRAVWRAGQLLRREEERFADEWRALPSVWTELILLATWAALDGDPRLEALPTWVRLLDARGDGLRVTTGEARRWIADGGSSVITAQAEDGEVVIRRLGVESGDLEERRVPTGLWVGTCPGEQGALGVPGKGPSRKLATALAEAAVAGVWPATGPAPGDHAHADTLRARGVSGAETTRQVADDRLLGVCALDARLVIAGDAGARVVGPTAAARLAVPGETDLEAFGRTATWLPDPAGPGALFGERAEEGGALLAEHRGRTDTAVVVPDGLDEAAVGRLRARLGRCWLVWSPVAAALAAAEARPDLFAPDAPEVGRTVLTIVATDAALDVSVLEERLDDERPGRLWVRSAPLPGPDAGREARRFAGDGDARGAWLRDPDAPEGWDVTGDLPRRVVVPPSAGGLVDDALARLTGWKGTQPSLCIAVGVSNEEAAALVERTGLPLVRLDGTALACGARVFLERHRAGRATWKDLLPSLAVEVRSERGRKEVALVEKGRLVAPGERIDFSPEALLTVGAGETRVEIPMRKEGREAPYALVLEGAGFPLLQPVRVRIHVKYTYGLQGLDGAVVPVESAPFARVPFRLAAPKGGGGAMLVDDAPAGAPTFSRGALGPGAEKDLRAAVAGLQRALDAVPRALLKQAETQPGKLDRELVVVLKPIADAASLQCGVGPEPGRLRDYLEREVAPLLDWLLGARKDGKARKGRAPLLGNNAKQAATRARGELAVSGDGAFARWLLGRPDGVPELERLRALGRTLDGGEAWRALLESPAATPPLQGAWAEAVRVAVEADPTLLYEQGVGALVLARAVAHLEGITAYPPAEVARFAAAVAALAELVPRTCLARAAGELAPGDPAVLDAVERLEAVRAALPEAVRKRGTRASVNTNDEPIAVAIDYLRGRYAARLELA